RCFHFYIKDCDYRIQSAVCGTQHQHCEGRTKNQFLFSTINSVKDHSLMSIVFDNIKSISTRIFRIKDEDYHPRDEEELDARRIAERSRIKERSRAEAAKIRSGVERDVHDRKNKHTKKHSGHEHLHYEKKANPSYSSLEHVGPPSVFHRSSPVCRKLRVNPKKHVM
ncbi:unnamed protein product, partial [Cylicocyclus nassatus]